MFHVFLLFINQATECPRRHEITFCARLVSVDDETCVANPYEYRERWVPLSSRARRRRVTEPLSEPADRLSELEPTAAVGAETLRSGTNTAVHDDYARKSLTASPVEQV